MDRAVHDAVLAVTVWVVLNQWSIWELIERERRRPTRKRRHEAQHSSEPRPFPGLAQKPACAECEKEEQEERCEEAAPPKMISGRGRPAEVDTKRQFCPNEMLFLVYYNFNSCLFPTQTALNVYPQVSGTVSMRWLANLLDFG